MAKLVPLLSAIRSLREKSILMRENTSLTRRNIRNSTIKKVENLSKEITNIIRNMTMKQIPRLPQQNIRKSRKDLQSSKEETNLRR